MYLTFDFGQSSTKMAVISPIGEVISFKSSDSNTEAKTGRDTEFVLRQYYDLLSQHSFEGIGVATTYLLRKPDRRAGYLPANGIIVLDTKEIEKETGVRSRIFNDGEAAALARNDHNLETRVIQKEDGRKRKHGFHLYLGTGFMGAITDFDYEANLFRTQYGFYWNNNVAVNTLDVQPELLEKIAEKARTSLSKLRWTHLLGKYGIQNIYNVLHAENRDAHFIIEDAQHQPDDNSKEVFRIYSAFLGCALKSFYETQGHDITHLFVEGGMTPAIKDLLQIKVMLNYFNPGGIYQEEYSQVPITLVTDLHATHKGIAIGLKHRLETTAGVAQQVNQ